MDLDDEFLKWEHTTAARAEFLWAIASLPLVRAADALWDRAAFASRVAAEVFAPPIGVVAAPDRRLTAEELDALQDHGIARVAIMLLGLAIENAAKTLIVRAEPEVVAHDGEWKLKSHDLIALVERAGRSTSDDDKLHLKVLADYVQWAGRYPVPLSAIGKGSPKSARGAWVPHRRPPEQQTWSAGRRILQDLLDDRDRSMFADPRSNDR